MKATFAERGILTDEAAAVPFEGTLEQERDQERENLLLLLDGRDGYFFGGLDSFDLVIATEEGNSLEGHVVGFWENRLVLRISDPGPETTQYVVIGGSVLKRPEDGDSREDIGQDMDLASIAFGHTGEIIVWSEDNQALAYARSGVFIQGVSVYYLPAVDLVVGSPYGIPANVLEHLRKEHSSIDAEEIMCDGREGPLRLAALHYPLVSGRIKRVEGTAPDGHEVKVIQDPDLVPAGDLN